MGKYSRKKFVKLLISRVFGLNLAFIYCLPVEQCRDKAFQHEHWYGEVPDIGNKIPKGT